MVLALVLLLFVDEKPLATTIEREIPMESLAIDGANHFDHRDRADASAPGSPENH
jgi:hypothetical protein